MVATLVDGLKSTGYQSAPWVSVGTASGVNIYRLEATSISDPSKHFNQTRKMVLIK
jgi:hypothetical protein